MVDIDCQMYTLQATGALDVQVEAIPEKMEIRIAVPLKFITIERTSA